MQLGRLEDLNSVNVSVVCRNKNYGDGKNANGRLKSSNSSSKLNNKGCPLICIKDQTIPLWIFQQEGKSGPNGRSVTVVSYDLGPSTTKNFQANFLKQELRIWRMPVEDSNLPTLELN